CWLRSGRGSSRVRTSGPTGATARSTEGRSRGGRWCAPRPASSSRSPRSTTSCCGSCRRASALGDRLDAGQGGVEARLELLLAVAEEEALGQGDEPRGRDRFEGLRERRGGLARQRVAPAGRVLVAVQGRERELLGPSGGDDLGGGGPAHQALAV